MERLYPIYTDLNKRRVLVIGGGLVAERKIAALLDTGAEVLVLAEEVTPAVSDWARHSKVQIQRCSLQVSGIAGWFDRWQLRRAMRQAWLVITATDDHLLNRYVASQGQRYRVFTNVVDDLELTQFQVPAVLQRGPIQAAISSAGVAPVMARRMRAELEVFLDESVGIAAELLSQWRQTIKQVLPDVAHRRQWYDKLLDSEFSQLIKNHQLQQAEQYLAQSLQAVEQPINESTSTGKVILVGAGPGDPGLLTIQALRELQQADVIVHDRLVSDEVLNLARRDAERILVAKRAGQHSTTQNQIHEILLSEAKAGKRVVRLKGGDPFVFGRGGEELQVLHESGIEFAIVPGISAAMACAAYSGIPLTHRDHAQSVRLVTAHCKDSMDRLDWRALAEDNQTLAVYMGVGQLGLLRQRLMAYGRAADTPFALVENGSRDNQRVIVGELNDLLETAQVNQVKSPAMLLLGQVAGLAQTLHWYGNKPIIKASLRQVA